MIASELNDAHFGKILVLGKNSKTRRGVIRGVVSNPSLVLVTVQSVSITAVPLNPSDEVHIEE